MKLEAQPRPEKVTQFSENQETLDTLAVGVTTVTHTPSGLRIRSPVKEIGIVIAKNSGENERSFSVPPKFARGLAARLIEFSDEIERESA